MLNNASKFALGVAGLAAVAAVGTRLADGDRVASLVLVGVVLAMAIVAYGVARAAGADLSPFVADDATPAATAIDPTDVARASFGPLVAAIGATVGAAGGALGPYWVLIGAIVAVVGVAIWLFDSYRTPGVVTARDAANVDNRFLGPLALPVASFLVAITVAYCFSRVLLAVNETASWVIAFIVAAVILAVLWVIAAKGPATKIAGGIAGVGAIVTLVAGGAFAGIGEREFHHAGEEIPTVEITAKDIAFDRKVIGLPADSKVQMIFYNLDVGTYHNVAIYTADEPGTPIYSGQPSADGTLTYKFETPGIGTYRFICDFHPAMVGEFRTTEATEESDEDHGESSEAEHDEPKTPVTSSSDAKESEH